MTESFNLVTNPSGELGPSGGRVPCRDFDAKLHYIKSSSI